METTLKVRYHLEPIAEEPQKQGQLLDLMEFDDSDGHGFNENGEEAVCRTLTLHGLVDCHVCLQSALIALESQLPDDEQKLMARKILEMTLQAKDSGVNKLDILASPPKTHAI